MIFIKEHKNHALKKWDGPGNKNSFKKIFSMYSSNSFLHLPTAIGECNAAFYKLKNEIPIAKIEILINNLLEYCGLDTLKKIRCKYPGSFRIFEKL